jgi:glycosyltransferase involved in cell wall biosynthesis
MKSEPKHILYYGDFNCTTGFGNVSKNLINRWVNFIDIENRITIVAINDRSTEPYWYAKNVYVLPAYLLNEDGETDVYARNALVKVLFNLDLDAFFFNTDVEVLNPLTDLFYKINEKKKAANKKQFKIFGYFPIDSQIKPADYSLLGEMEHCFVYTQFAHNEIVKSKVPHGEITILPHGSESKVFMKLKPEKIKKLRTKYFPNHDLVIGSVNRNSIRKDIGTLIIAFKKLKQDLIANSKLKPTLYLHMNPKDPFGIDIQRVCENLGLVYGEDVKTPLEFSENKGFDPSELNELYNCFDLFATTTTSEGWGLTITEAMLCKVPVVAPAHTSITELTSDEGGAWAYQIVDLSPFIFVRDYDKIRYISHVDNVVAQMKYAIDDLGKNEKMLLTAWNKTNSFSWDMTARTMIEEIYKKI